MLNHHNSTAVLIRTEDDGTLVYRRKNKIIRVARTVIKPCELTGFYPPGGRHELYKSTGGKDQRSTKWYAESVREYRRQGHRAGVRPGPQSMT